MKKHFSILVLILFYGCTNRSHTSSITPTINDLADCYYEQTLLLFPEQAYFADIRLNEHNGISSNKLSDVIAWQKFEDSLNIELHKIDESNITDKKDKITYWLLKEELESSIAMRICKRNLWDVNHLNGWQNTWIKIAEFQPVGTKELRSQALARWKKLPLYIYTEIENLRLGISKGYTMPKVIVNLVIDQIEILLDYSLDESPLMSPATRDGDEAFYSEWAALITEHLIPSISDYQEFLKNEYLESAREDVSILSLPNGDACYQAYIRKMTTTNKTGQEIFDLGQQIVSDNMTRISEQGNDLYHTADFEETIDAVKSDKSDYFQTSDEILEFNTQLLQRAQKECNNWFKVLPSSEVIIKPYEPYESGIGGYEQATGDKPAYFRINLKNPELQRKGGNEVLTLHEAYPGHHLQIGIQKDIDDIHPISKLTQFMSYIEGWARYSEQLSEEMGLYETKSALIGRRAWPSRGMVVDPGIHLKNWTKEQAISYMLESGYFNKDMVLGIYHRIIVWPAQLTTYDVGGEEFKALRKLAEERLGSDFKIKEFHFKILENGSIPLSALKTIVVEWTNN